MVVKWRICNVSVNSSIPNELQPHLENPPVKPSTIENYLRLGVTIALKKK
jgi:hypothetical protein